MQNSNPFSPDIVPVLSKNTNGLKVGWSLRISRMPLGFELSGSVLVFGHDAIEQSYPPWPGCKHRLNRPGFPGDSNS